MDYPTYRQSYNYSITDEIALATYRDTIGTKYLKARLGLVVTREAVTVHAFSHLPPVSVTRLRNGRD